MTKISKTAIWREAGIAFAIASAVGLFSLWLYWRGGGEVVAQGPFYGSDIFRVRENLLHPLSQEKSYFRLSVHPLFGLICIAAQFIHKLSGLSEYDIYALLGFANGALFGALLYACARLWGASIALGSAIVAFYCSTAGFIYWTSVTETHPWGGLSLLIVIAMARWEPPAEKRTLWFALSFMASFSILVTNAMAWLLSRLPFDRTSPKAALQAMFREPIALRIVGELLAGLGLVLLGYTVTRKLLRGAQVGQLLDFGAEKKFITHGFSYPFNGFNITGLVGPPIDYSTSAAVFVNAAFGLIACATFFVVPPRLRFVPAFLAFALLFHSHFVRYQGFLFAIEYTAVATLIFGLALGTKLKRGAAVLLLVISAPLAIVNVSGFFDAVALQGAGHGSPRPQP